MSFKRPSETSCGPGNSSTLAVEGDAGACHPRYGWQSPALYVCDPLEISRRIFDSKAVDECGSKTRESSAA